MPIRITDYINTSSPIDKYPTHLANLGKGGFRSVTGIDERDSIASERKEIGMWVNVIGDAIYEWNGNDWIKVTGIGEEFLFTGVLTNETLSGNGNSTQLGIAFSNDSLNIATIGSDGKLYVPATSGIIVKDENNTLTNNLSSLNFVGGIVTATNVGNNITVTINETGIFTGVLTSSTITGNGLTIPLGVPLSTGPNNQLRLGPDNRLYVPTGNYFSGVSVNQAITGNGNNIPLGIAISPSANNLLIFSGGGLYVPTIDDFTGVKTNNTITGNGETTLLGIPLSIDSNNQLRYGSDGRLYVPTGTYFTGNLVTNPITGDGKNNPLGLRISNQTNNLIQLTSSGIYALSGNWITGVSTNLPVTGNGVNIPLGVRLSNNANNQLRLGSDNGLFVPTGSYFNGNLVTNPITGDGKNTFLGLRISSDSNNILQLRANGLYGFSGSWITGVNTSTTITGNGVNIPLGIPVSIASDNQLTYGPDGRLYVPTVDDFTGVKTNSTITGNGDTTLLGIAFSTNVNNAATTGTDGKLYVPQPSGSTVYLHYYYGKTDSSFLPSDQFFGDPSFIEEDPYNLRSGSSISIKKTGRYIIDVAGTMDYLSSEGRLRLQKNGSTVAEIMLQDFMGDDFPSFSITYDGNLNSGENITLSNPDSQMYNHIMFRLREVSSAIAFYGSFTGYPLEVRNEGLTLTSNAAVLDFVGPGVNATNAGNIVTVNVGDTFTGVIRDNTLTGDGKNFNLGVPLSANANNQLKYGSDGRLYVPTGTYFTGVRVSQSITGNGLNIDLGVPLSSNTNNGLIYGSDGRLFAKNIANSNLTSNADRYLDLSSNLLQIYNGETFIIAEGPGSYGLTIQSGYQAIGEIFGGLNSITIDHTGQNDIQIVGNNIALIATDASGGALLKFYNGSEASGKYVGLTVPSGKLANDITFVLPTGHGNSGNALVTDGNGNLRFDEIVSFTGVKTNATLTGNGDTTLLGIPVSSNANNQLRYGSDGRLFVPTGTYFTGASVLNPITGNGSTNPLGLRISNQANNLIQLTANGIYALSGSWITGVSTNLPITGNGVNTPVGVRISNNANNQLKLGSDNGLFVPTGDYFTGVLTNNTISGNGKTTQSRLGIAFSTNANNIATTGTDGRLYVPEPSGSTVYLNYYYGKTNSSFAPSGQFFGNPNFIEEDPYALRVGTGILIQRSGRYIVDVVGSLVSAGMGASLLLQKNASTIAETSLVDFGGDDFPAFAITYDGNFNSGENITLANVNNKSYSDIMFRLREVSSAIAFYGNFTGYPLEVRNEGLTLTNNAAVLDFVGENVNATNVGNVVTVNIESSFVGVSGTGTTNYIPKWNDSTTLGDSLIYNSGTNVGISTSNPDRKLEINDVDGNCLRLTRNDSNGNATNFCDFQVSSAGDLIVNPSGGDVEISGNTSIAGTLAVTGNTTLSGTLGVTGAATFTSSVNGARLSTPQSSLFISNGTLPKAYVAGQVGQSIFIGLGQAANIGNAYANARRSVGIGYQSLKDLTTGEDHVAIGHSALLSITEANRCTAVGIAVLSKVTDGSFNTAFGAAAGNELLQGAKNTFLGWSAANKQTEGSENIAIGPDVALDSLTGSYQINIGKRYFHDRIQLKNAASGAGDCILLREAANQLAMRNGESSQTFHLYNTYTNSTNYERGFLRWDTNKLLLGTEELGNGSARALELQTDGTTRVAIDATKHNIAIGRGADTGLAAIPTLQSIAACLQINGDSATGSTLTHLLSFRRSQYDPNGSSASIAVWRGGGTREGELAFSTNPGSADAQQPTERMRITAAGNVGIGTTSPLGRLHIADTLGGPIYLQDTEAPSTHNIFEISHNNGAVQFATRSAAGVALSTDYQAVKDTSGTNYHRWFTDGNNERLRINKTGNIGIGTTVPGRRLDVNDASGNCLRLTYDDANGSAANYADFLVSSSGDLNISPTRNVGINTSSPTAKLDVNGTANFSSTINAPNLGAGEDNSVVILDSDGKLRTDEINPIVWNTSISLSSGSGTTNYIPKWTNSTTIGDSLIYNSGTNVGISTTNPGRKLEINDISGNCLRLTHNDSDGNAANFCDFSVSSAGDLVVNSSGGDVEISGNTSIAGTLTVTGAATMAALSATTGAFSSTLAVTGAATFSSTINALQVQRFNSASSAGVAVTTGSRPDFAQALAAKSVFVGLNICPAITPGSTNNAANTVAIGNNLLLSLTTGSYNLAIGELCLSSVTTSSANTAIGAQAGRYASGANSVFIGYQAGNTQTSGDYNIFVGRSVQPDSTTGSYQINIGDRYFHDRIALKNAASGAGDCILLREAANELAMRNLANEQTFRIYNSYTNSSTYDRAFIKWDTNILKIGTELDPASSAVLPARALQLQTGGTTHLTIKEDGNVGIGTTSPSYKLQVDGSFGATTKSFRIDHPSKKGYTLEYGSLESPYHGVRLTGRGKVIKGTAIIKLPDYLKDLIHDDENINVQITNIKHGKVIYFDEIDLKNDLFVVKTEENLDKELEFFWVLTGVRKDVENLIVEQKK